MVPDAKAARPSACVGGSDPPPCSNRSCARAHGRTSSATVVPRARRTDASPRSTMRATCTLTETTVSGLCGGPGATPPAPNSTAFTSASAVAASGAR